MTIIGETVTETFNLSLIAAIRAIGIAANIVALLSSVFDTFLHLIITLVITSRLSLRGVFIW